MKSDIKDRNDIDRLIRNFYMKVLDNKDIGKFFAEAVKSWDYHQERFVDYWEAQVLFHDSYEGSPLQGHIDVDRKFGHGFKPQHFEIWLRLFEGMVNDLFEGDKAELAKEAARNMAQNIYKKMFIGRKPEKRVFD
jgi:hemoglobin